MSLLDELKTYGRFAWGLPGYLRQTLTLDQATAIVQRRLAERESAFLRLVERGIYGYARSPYLPLLRLAQCELGDLQAMVKSKGLEPTLCALRAAGVYVSFEEFKGRAPIVRGGHTFSVHANDFDNPYLNKSYYVRTSGSTGAGTRVPMDLDYLLAYSANAAIFYATHGVFQAPIVAWRGLLPDPTGMRGLLLDTPLGMFPHVWYVPLSEQQSGAAFKHRLANWYILQTGRALGHPYPQPEPLPLTNALPVAQAVAATLREHGRCLVRSGISRHMRIAIAARDAGLDLTGAVFIGGGEPATPAKTKPIIDVGGRLVPDYGFIEAGQVGFSCGTPQDENDIHLTTDTMALIQASRQVPGADLTVDAFNFTTLMAEAPKILLNVESDDYGLVETRPCGCLLGELGMTVHLRHIRSFRKLTGEGVTLVGSEMLHILEDVLPAHFGGSPLDYQLQEEEDATGFTRLYIVISPRLSGIDEAAVIGVVMEALSRSSMAAHMARVLWTQAGTLRVRRAEPVMGARYKLNPLHLVRRTPPKSD